MRRIWAGERDWHALAEGSDSNSALVVLRVIEAIKGAEGDGGDRGDGGGGWTAAHGADRKGEAFAPSTGCECFWQFTASTHLWR